MTVTDGVVWALSSAVIDSLKSLDYSANNLGWGVTEAAAAVAVTTNRTIAMDLTLKVQHPQGSGYDRDKALRESLAFRRGLSPAQQAYFEVLTSLAQVRQALDAPRSRWPSRLKAALRARLRPGPVASDP